MYHSLNDRDLVKKLLQKSNEAFILAIEIFNKPTISYRVEGFSFFICNAWELLLKARIIFVKGEERIYFKDNPNRTISIENCIREIFSNDKDPLRINLEKIIELRNTSTHFITEEYEQIYVPLFQACVRNYGNKLLEFFNIDITEQISSNFLNLSMKISDINPEEIQARYPKQIAEKLLDTLSRIENFQKEIENENFAVFIHHNFYITKNEKLAAAKISISKNADTSAFVLRESKDRQAECPYTTKKIIDIINRWIKRDGLKFVNPKAKKEYKANVFNTACFQTFIKFYGMKNESKYCYKYDRTSQASYSYSDAALNFIYSEIKKNPEGVMKALYIKSEKPTSGAKDF